ncbi:MAG TPA: phosphopantothenoylcysteine decarboxylase [candidate division Zixibacteria bacterium]|nr:phosphopantothenoylcysteine decarboxylase [candidate division Zixibacteria bacterium]MDM7973268.1 phosphopantothenoylcysteine decarboxylase [candidate division Zixibacteria bacterium]HOD66792.1 phosphopantothenoylcysteine decarboxylase [candidate division Zixibacteria bacterium]HPI32059.1 phosphopantothenoylcysteine decarboxylase [candidate division Zixibacteria bacterium]HPM37326.1 phosphopantothenoylcysteine decarboxylase [candidate division Zixibacteria bacterium]
MRYITNYSSGKMGYAIAAAAAEQGASVTLISGPVELAAPEGVVLVRVESTAELHRAVGERFAQCDCLVMAAAPADYRPSRISSEKIKRIKNLRLELEATGDILKDVAAGKRAGQIVVGFALETTDGVANARRKLREKKLDLIVLNEPSADSGFLTDTNRVQVIGRDGEAEEWPLLAKGEVARRLVARVAAMLGKR